MILFEDDWKKYPSAIADTDTPNRSFVRISLLYRQMGVKNHTFMLALVNPLLRGVDPFSDKLSKVQEGMIAFECKINPWYYFREVAVAPSKTGNETVPFEANRGNMSLLWLFFNHITLILIQIRQTGKSFSVDQLATYLLNIRCTNTQINLLTKDDTLRAENIRRLKDIDSELPHYLKQRTKNDANNLEELTIRSLNNSYRAHVPQKSAKMALNVGRGLTSPIFLIDEGPFQPNIGIALPAALAAGTAAREIARKNGEPFGTILTTTAGKRDDRDGKFIYNLVEESAEWNEKFLDCKDITELEAMIRRHSRKGKLRVNCTFNHKQLGKSDMWLKQAIEDTANADPESIDRDFFNRWTTGSMSSPIPLHVLEKIRASQKQELHTSIDAPYSYVTRWYIPEEDIAHRMANGHYILGMDTSDASGGDDISLFIMDIANAETICAGNYNETNLLVFSQWLCTWFQRFPNLTAIIERKSSGVAIIDNLLVMLPSLDIDPFRRLFNLAVQQGKEEDEERWKEINLAPSRRPWNCYTVHKKTFGFATSGSGMASRSELYSTTLQLAAKKAGDKMSDKTTINQVVGLITQNGRVDHAPGEHDDMVIAWLLCFWLITLGRNLSFYGINSKNILCEVDLPEAMTQREQFEMLEQQQYRSEIEHIYKQLGDEKDDFVIQKLEHQLRVLNRRLVLEEGERFSVDELINSLREDRRNSRHRGESRYPPLPQPNQHQNYGIPSGYRNVVSYR